jgi:hypothetical protein
MQHAAWRIRVTGSVNAGRAEWYGAEHASLQHVAHLFELARPAVDIAVGAERGEEG